MKKVYTASNQVDIYIIKDMLEERKIDCLIRGEMLKGAIGELPAQVFIELWVMDNDDEQAALAVVRQYEETQNGVSEISWQCSKCSEKHTDNFTRCWRCGTDRTILD